MAANQFEFTETQYNDFLGMLKGLNFTNWGSWDTSKWICFEGLPSYSINQYEQTNGKSFVVVKFDSIVLLPDERKGKRFKVGGQRGYQPDCERF